jgi:hypothetical protein
VRASGSEIERCATYQGPNSYKSTAAALCRRSPEVSLRVACMGGTTLGARVAQRGLVLEVKRLVGQVRGRGLFGMASASSHSALLGSQMREMEPGLIELFVDGKEDGLPDSGRLHAASTGLALGRVREQDRAERGGAGGCQG